MRRLSWGPGRSAPLDFGQELWSWQVSRYESAPGIIAGLERAGRPYDDNSILVYATQTLVRDVIEAAGAVESAYERFRTAMASAESSFQRWSDTVESHTARESYFSDIPLEDAWYAMEDMLSWVRTLGDRLKRDPLDRKRADQGLIPALADGPRRDAVIRARSRLANASLDEARQLANLSLHMQSTQAGTRSAKILNDRLVVRFPDRVSGPVSHRWQLTYENDRNAAFVADEIMTSVERFMDDLLSAFEDNVPVRFKTGSTPADV